MLNCMAVWVADERATARWVRACLKLTVTTVWRFWVSLSTSRLSSRLKPWAHWVRLKMSSLPVSLELPPAVTFPSVSASLICSETMVGMPSMAPSMPVRMVALGPSLSIVLNWLMDWARMKVLTSITHTS